MDFPARLTAYLGSAARVSAWICVAAIAYLSLVPHSMEIRTPMPAGLEHAIAYAGTACPPEARLSAPSPLGDCERLVRLQWAPGGTSGLRGWSAFGGRRSAVERRRRAHWRICRRI